MTCRMLKRPKHPASSRPRLRMAEYGWKLIINERLQQVFSADLENVGESGEEVAGAEFGAGHVFPTFQRIFVDHALDLSGVLAVALEIASDDFHVKDPFGQKGVSDDIADTGGDAKEFGSALGVVDRKSQEQRNNGSEDTAEIVAAGMALDMAAEQFDAGAEDHSDGGVSIEDMEKTWDGVEGGRQIGIPKTDGFAIEVLDGVEQPAADGFGFTDVLLAADDSGLGGKAVAERFEEREGGVLAAVVDKDEADGIGALQKLVKGGDVQALGFVVAGDDDRGAAKGGGSRGARGLGHRRWPEDARGNAFGNFSIVGGQGGAGGRGRFAALRLKLLTFT